MLTRRVFLLSTACASVALPALADDASARAFVTAIYDAYKGKDAKGIMLDNERTIRRYFEPSLAALIVRDQKDAARRKEVPALDGDPFVDAQDWDIAGFDIAIADTAPGAATATVGFRNGATPATIVLALVTAANDWRIANITWQHDGKPETLRGLFRH
jgi:Protein of unknown function (DUF3828)